MTHLLTIKEKELITATWAKAEENRNQVGIELFIRLFRDNPSYQAYFSFRDVATLEELREDKRLKAHARNVMYNISMMVSSIDEADVLEEMVKKLVQSHQRRSLTVEHFVQLKRTLIALLVDMLGVQLMTEEAITAWAKMYELLLCGMKKTTNNTH